MPIQLLILLSRRGVVSSIALCLVGALSATGIVNAANEDIIESTNHTRTRVTRKLEPAKHLVNSEKSQYVSGELIVKFIPEVGQALEEALEAKRALSATGLDWLDKLNARHGVTQVVPLFPHHTDLEAIKQRYPERTRRAPLEAKIPTLRYIYKLTLRKNANILQAASMYSAQPQVEYAEPNYLATIDEGGTGLP